MADFRTVESRSPDTLRTIIRAASETATGNFTNNNWLLFATISLTYCYISITISYDATISISCLFLSAAKKK